MPVRRRLAFSYSLPNATPMSNYITGPARGAQQYEREQIREQEQARRAGPVVRGSAARGIYPNRFGTAIRNPDTGRQERGEVNEQGLPMGGMGVPGGKNAGMTREQHQWDPAWGQDGTFNPLRGIITRPGPTSPDWPGSGRPGPVSMPGAAGSAGVDPSGLGVRPLPESAPAPASPLRGLVTRPADGGYGMTTPVTGSSGIVHQVQSNNLGASMESAIPGFAQMAPADKANAFRTVAGVPQVNSAPAVNGSRIDSQYGTASVRTPVSAPAVPGTDWEHQIVQQYPEIGQAGTPENAAFLAAYSQHKDPGRAMETAQGVYRARDMGGATSATAAGSSPIQPPRPPGAPAPVYAADPEGTPPNPNAVTDTRSPGEQGAAEGAAARTAIVNKAGSILGGAADAASGWLDKNVNRAAGFLGLPKSWTQPPANGGGGGATAMSTPQMPPVGVLQGLTKAPYGPPAPTANPVNPVGPVPNAALRGLTKAGNPDDNPLSNATSF